MSDEARAPAAPVASRRSASLRDFEPLRRAEQMLLAAFASGDIAKVGFRLPEAASAGTSVRGSFIAFLAAGGEGRRRAPRRIQLIGAWVEGRVDLCGEAIASSLWFYRCAFDAAPAFDDTRLAGSLAFPGCRLPGLQAEACRVAGDLLLNSGCTFSGEVELSRAVVRGRFDAARARLCVEPAEPAVAVPLRANGLRVAGDLSIGDGFAAVGELQFIGARVDGNFLAGHARLSGPLEEGGARGDALNLERAWIGGDLRLDTGFSVAGRVRLRRARIDGDLDAGGAAFDLVGDAGWGGATSLMLDRARIAGALRLDRLQGALHGASLVDARVGTLVDDALTWGDRLALDGFRYGRFGEGAPVDSETRVAWLMRQLPAHLGADHRPAPWRRLIRVLRRGGHDDAAREVAIARETLLRRIGRVGRGLPVALRWTARAAHRAWGALASYGYRPLRLLGWLAALWLACAALYWAADGEGSIAPTQPVTAGARLRPETFEPMLYSLEHVLPGIDLRQQREWRPHAPSGPWACVEGRSRDCWGAAALWAGWFEALLGWAAWLAFAAAVTGVTQRDRR